MKIATPLLNHVIECSEDFISSLVIENGVTFRLFMESLVDAMESGGEEVIISNNGKTLQAKKTLDIISIFVPFSLNNKTLLASMNKRLEKIANEATYLDKTNNTITNVSEYLKDILLEIPHEVDITGLSAGSIIKAGGLEFEEDDIPLTQKLMDYFRLVREFDGEKLYVLINARSYFSDEEMTGLSKLALSEKFTLLLIDAAAHTILPDEKRLLIDNDLCELTDADDALPLPNMLKT